VKLSMHMWILGPDGKTPIAVPVERWMKDFERNGHHIALWTDGLTTISLILFGMHAAPFFEIRTVRGDDDAEGAEFDTYDEGMTAWRAGVAFLEANGAKAITQWVKELPFEDDQDVGGVEDGGGDRGAQEGGDDI
jgi:hypothetical protein